MSHPEGRLLAIQQQMAFANLITKGDYTAEVLLDMISEAGLCLAPDVNEVALDAARLLPKINNPKSRLKSVKGDA